MSEWQPIETIPHDGEAYLATNARIYGFTQVVYWDNDALNVPDADIIYSHEFFTHWMPIPNPPEMKQ